MFLIITMTSMFLMMSLILMILNIMISNNKIMDREKNSPFECGFDPLSNSRLPFSMQFYMISIIFLIFDIEVIIFFPFIPSFNFIYNEMNLFMLTFFLFILLLGLYIEWNDGALKWLK